MADIMPPVIAPPIIEAWPATNANRPLPGGNAAGRAVVNTGGLAVPRGSPQTFSTQKTALFNGTRVFPVNAASIKIIDQPSSTRNLLHIRNSSPGTQIIYVEFGADASANSCLRLDVNEQMLYDAVVPQDDIYVFSSAAGGQVSVLVSNIALPE